MSSKPKKIVMVSLIIVNSVLGLFVYNTINKKEELIGNQDVKTTANNVVVDEIFKATVLNKQEKVSEDPIVYDNLTLKQLGDKIDKSLSGKMKGKGFLIARYSLYRNVDPYIATSIILLETGCEWKCSTMVVRCNNVGGQKGKGCGAYQSFPTLDEGIRGFIDNLDKNYFSKGLTTPQAMGSRYAESPTWAQKVSKYVYKVKSK